MSEAELPWWAREDLWRKCAIWITGLMAVVLIFMTFDTMDSIAAGGDRVPSYSVINHRIDYRYDPVKEWQMPVIGPEVPLFGKKLTEAEAKALVDRGKMTVQAKNCMNCHTLLGNGAYYAPDLTKAWLDPVWGSEEIREQLMISFLLDPYNNARTFGTNRRMPDMKLTNEEAEAVVAFLKWMSAIDTNGFPKGFTPMRQGT